jgi:hypothetical protein
MAGLKDSWKETGTGLGHAFRDLGKTVIKTAKTGTDKAEEWASKDDKQQQEVSLPQENSPENNAQTGLKDSWKETGTGLGHAFRDLGKTVIKTAKTGADKADEWASKDDKSKNEN